MWTERVGVQGLQPAHTVVEKGGGGEELLLTAPNELCRLHPLGFFSGCINSGRVVFVRHGGVPPPHDFVLF